MMESEFVPYEQALELKKLGFDELCLAGFYGGGFEMYPRYDPLRNIEIKEAWFCVTHLWQQVFRWFREKHNISCSVNQDWHQGEFLGYEGYIESIDGEHNVNTETFNTYEEAELECIKELIKFVKQLKPTSFKKYITPNLFVGL